MEPTAMEFDWINLGAVGVCLMLLVFMVTQVMPKMFTKYTEELRTEREAFQASLKEQRTDFQNTMTKQHEMFIQVADRGNDTMKGLAKQVERLASSIDRTNGHHSGGGGGTPS